MIEINSEMKAMAARLASTAETEGNQAWRDYANAKRSLEAEFYRLKLPDYLHYELAIKHYCELAEL